jgi:hypothetical protein
VSWLHKIGRFREHADVYRQLTRGEGSIAIASARLTVRYRGHDVSLLLLTIVLTKSVINFLFFGQRHRYIRHVATPSQERIAVPPG